MSKLERSGLLPVDLILRYSPSKLEKVQEKQKHECVYIWGATADLESTFSTPKPLNSDSKIIALSFGLDQKFIISGKQSYFLMRSQHLGVDCS